ncbi:MAG: methylmalonyl-CoA mutase family protein [Microthrixaceae bacterium]|nr:methylmalonyl-CoA mutase family protein [Microthrixaceae bacterium]
MAQACGVDPSVSPPALVVRTLRRNLSRRDPWVNMLRVTSAAFAAALGGADTVITAAFDSELGRPSELGRRMARNTQLLLSEESNVGRVIDPAGGSWYIESLTEAIAAEAWDTFRMIEAAGGMPAVLVDGTFATRIRSVRDRRGSAVATRKAPITGVSEFPDLHEQLPVVDPAPSGEPLPAPETDAATDCEPLQPVRWAEPFEALRDAADAARASGGSPERSTRGFSSRTWARSPPTQRAHLGQELLRSRRDRCGQLAARHHRGFRVRHRGGAGLRGRPRTDRVHLLLGCRL